MITIIERHGKNSDEAANYEIEILLDGKRIAGFMANPLYECPEDASLERDMAFAYKAIDFFKLGYEAGLIKEVVEYKEAPERF